MTERLAELRERLAEWMDLRSAAELLQWDQQTMMPRRGGAARAESLATLERISHELFVSADTGRLLDAAATQLSAASPDSDDACLVSVTRRRWEKARRVPSALAADLARAGSVGQEAWVQAREQSDYAAFAPHLRRNLELARRYVDCFEGYECAYDVLLDDYEPEMKTTQVTRLFTELRGELVPLISALSERSELTPDACLHGRFPIDRQRRLVELVLGRMGFDRDGWRLDDAVHPFAMGLSSSDVRITSRWDETYFASGLYGAMHECGHGLYEAGIADTLQRTPLGHGESLGLHESQSRMWENMVGRGREFCGVLAPAVAECFEGSAPDLEPETLFRAVNRVAPSFIRVEADEATYGLHVVLRFELEQELIEGRLAVAELPEAWNARVSQYLGLEVPDDAHGVLQDVHWAAGMIGYFPTYALGNLIAGQLWERAHAEVPELDARIAAGDLAPLRDWLRERVHRHGAKFTSAQLLQRVVGQEIEVGPFISYLKRKLSDAYGVRLEDVPL
ncbi:MAG: carboxypeptidase M32 [Solirubrobacteraceae bacterium]